MGGHCQGLGVGSAGVVLGSGVLGLGSVGVALGSVGVALGCVGVVLGSVGVVPGSVGDGVLGLGVVGWAGVVGVLGWVGDGSDGAGLVGRPGGWVEDGIVGADEVDRGDADGDHGGFGALGVAAACVGVNQPAAGLASFSLFAVGSCVGLAGPRCGRYPVTSPCGDSDAVLVEVLGDDAAIDGVLLVESGDENGPKISRPVSTSTIAATPAIFSAGGLPVFR
ncbi:hypothetical protein E0H75_18675 [Kribbella capetownensis]|uniref:Uncharacterized protein n=1 Tax=Kribbella capetownensis TaxID=1572659 RepID=A0A4R0K1E2_9ACTN|nr:hypothetical protein [Kribbella capetownensis]TCC48615.1 hypothetical protein E0H75_18675 [Kribbella capetownensis]